MNEIIDKSLLAGDKFMPEMHLKQPTISYKIFETNSSFQVKYPTTAKV